MSEETSQSSHLDIILFSDEEGEVIVEGDEEDEALTNGVYEQYYDDAVFEIDDLPMEYDIPSSPPEIQVRYYVPNHQEPHGLSQSVILDETDYFSRIQTEQQQQQQEESSQTSIHHNQTISHHHHHHYENLDIPQATESTMIYSQSAPAVTSFLSDFSINQFKLTDDQESVHSDSSTDTITQVTVLMHNSGSFDKRTRVTHHDQQVQSEEQQQDTIKVEHEEDQQDDDTETENQDISEAQQNRTEMVQQDDTDEIKQDDSAENVHEKITKVDETEKEYDTPSESQQSATAATAAADDDDDDNDDDDTSLSSNVVSLMPSPCNSDETDNQLQMVLSSSAHHMTSSNESYESELYEWHNLATIHFRAGHIELPSETMNSDYQSITRHAVPIKVTGIPLKSRHKDIVNHFFDPNALSIRYINKLRCAYVTYRNYQEMIKASIKYNGSVMNGKHIFCRPSLLEELEQDNELNSKIIYYTSLLHPIQPGFSRDLFIPERHGIAQYPESDIPRRSVMPISQYCPRSISSTEETDLVIQQPRHSAFRAIPFIKSVTAINGITPQYIIMKPWLRLDLEASKKYQYWSVSLKKAFQLNYLFRNSLEVNLIFSVTSTKAFQGYAVMKSEVLDLKSLVQQEIVGTIFQETGSQFRTTANGRPWRYVCRVEWRSEKKLPFSLTKQLSNPSFNNQCINISKDCTVVEPNVGRELIQLMSDY